VLLYRRPQVPQKGLAIVISFIKIPARRAGIFFAYFSGAGKGSGIIISPSSPFCGGGSSLFFLSRRRGGGGGGGGGNGSFSSPPSGSFMSGSVVSPFSVGAVTFWSLFVVVSFLLIQPAEVAKIMVAARQILFIMIFFIYSVCNCLQKLCANGNILGN